MLSPWNRNRILVDPFCGSGTFPIEAALMAANIAPGMNRTFTACGWENLVPDSFFTEAKKEAKELIDVPKECDIEGYDLDESMIRVAKENAKVAGVAKLIHFEVRDVKDLHHDGKYGFIITNPPYGERLEEKSALPGLYKTIGEKYHELDSWSMYLISSYENAERDLGGKSTKNRKIYNGMLKTYLYQYMGAKPPKA